MASSFEDAADDRCAGGVRVLKARGCSQVFVSEPSPIRTEIARSCGVDAVLNPMSVNVVEEVRRLTHGKGVDVAFECAGNQNALDAALETTRARGKVVVVALWEKRATIDLFGVSRSHFLRGQEQTERRLTETILAGRNLSLSSLENGSSRRRAVSSSETWTLSWKRSRKGASRSTT